MHAGRDCRRLADAWLARCMLALLCCTYAAAAYASPTPLQPTDYHSSTSGFRWLVDPSRRDGGGGARYVLYRNDERLGSWQHEFTLQSAVVTASGTLAGVAYTEGAQRDDGDFLVAWIDASGSGKILAREPRTASRYIHADGNPQALGVVVDGVNERLVVRVADVDVNRRSESWWQFALADGAPLGRVQPRPLQSDNASLLDILDVQPIPDTGLTLVQWYAGDLAADTVGTRFALLDKDLKAAWSLDLKADFEGLSEQHAQLAREDGTVLAIGPGQFSVWAAAQAARIDFRVLQTVDSPARVEELARVPHPGPAPPPDPEDLPFPPERALPHLGSIELATETDDGTAFGELYDFSIDDRGRFGFIGRTGEFGAAIVLLDAGGQLLHNTPLEIVPKEHLGTAKLTHVKGDRWLLSFDDRKQTVGYWLDAASQRLEPIAGLRAPPFEELAPMGDGGFVALTELHDDYGFEQSVIAFDAQGQSRWVIEEGEGEGKLFNPADLTVTTDGNLVILENSRRQLQTFDRNGRSLGVTDLAERWGRKPSYPVGIEADRSGGVVIRDSGGQPQIVHMPAHGELAGFTAKHASGQRFDIVGNVQLGPDGRFWTSDGGALLRLDGAGIVDQIIGPPPGGQRIESVAAVAVSRSGRIHLVEQRTGAVHVFAANGERICVGRPDVGDYAGDVSLPSLTVDDHGDIFVERGKPGSKPDFLHYSATCERIGIRATDLGDMSQDWVSQSGSPHRWIIGTDVYRVDAEDRVVARIERTPAGRWIDPELGASAEDGTLAVLHDASAGFYPDRQRVRHPKFLFYSPAGAPLRELRAPLWVTTWATLSFASDRLAFLAASDKTRKDLHVWVMDATTGSSYRVPAHGAKPTAVFLVSPTTAGTELWMFDGARRFERFRLP